MKSVEEESGSTLGGDINCGRALGAIASPSKNVAKSTKFERL